MTSEGTKWLISLISCTFSILDTFFAHELQVQYIGRLNIDFDGIEVYISFQVSDQSPEGIVSRQVVSRIFCTHFR